MRVSEVAGSRHDHVRRHIGAAEVLAQRLSGEPLDSFLRAENGPAERVSLPEILREELVHEIVGRILDHLDFFEDDFLFATDLVFDERGTHDDVREQLDGERQMLVEHLDVVAGVLFRRERVELAANRVDRLRDILGRSRVGALEEHVLDEVRNPAERVGFVARPPRQPHANRHGPNLRHRLGDETETGIQHFADNQLVLNRSRVSQSGG